MPNRENAIQNAASLLSSFCGREPGGLSHNTCEHDHTRDAEAFVRMVEQYAFPELLRGFVKESSREGCSVDTLVREKIEELETRAVVVEPR